MLQSIFFLTTTFNLNVYVRTLAVLNILMNIIQNRYKSYTCSYEPADGFLSFHFSREGQLCTAGVFSAPALPHLTTMAPWCTQDNHSLQGHLHISSWLTFTCPDQLWQWFSLVYNKPCSCYHTVSDRIWDSFLSSIKWLTGVMKCVSLSEMVYLLNPSSWPHYQWP